MVADQLSTDWIKWRRRTRLDLILLLPLRGAQKTVIMRLADHLGEKEAAATDPKDARRWCWPSVAKLALACGCSDRTVQTALEQLEAAGLIEKAVRFERDTGRQTTNHYRIVWAEVGRLTEVAPMSCWKRPNLNRPAKTSPSPRSHFTPPVKIQHESFTPPVKPLHPMNGMETQERHSPATDRPTLAVASGRRRGREMFRGWFESETLRLAIRRRDARTLRRAFDELGDAAKFAAPVPSEAFELFAAMAYDATRAAKTSPVGLLAIRLGRGEVTRESVTAEGLRWAHETITPADRPQPLPSTTCWLCAARGHHSPTCDVCGTKPSPLPKRGATREELSHV